MPTVAMPRRACAWAVRSTSPRPKSGMAKAEKDNVYLQLGQVSAVNLTMGAAMAKTRRTWAGHRDRHRR